MYKINKNQRIFTADGRVDLNMSKKSEVSNTFNEKGTKAEDFVYELAKKTFLKDWCYLRPRLPENKGKKELCDLLIVYDDIAIIWQVKDTKLDKNGKRKKSDIDKNKKQLLGAKRQLFELKTPVELENPRRGKELFNPALIQRIFLISALVGPDEESYDFVEITNNNVIHIFSKEFTEIALKELDTIWDFIEYLRKKENLIRVSKSITLYGGEKELLAYYLMNNRGFDRFEKIDSVIIEQCGWEQINNRPEYIAKKEADMVSYGWDSLIDRAHTGGSEYEKVARELARPNRFNRRVLGRSFYDAWVSANQELKNNRLFRMIDGIGTTYCFVFLDESFSRDVRKSMLLQVCYVARGSFKKNKKVIGIATEMKIKPECSYDFFVLEQPGWTQENQIAMEAIQEKYKIFVMPKLKSIHASEYPEKIT